MRNRVLGAAACVLLGVALVHAPAGSQTTADALNMTLVGQNTLGGASGGEGQAMKIAPATTRYAQQGHHYLYEASEAFGDPVDCFSIIDVEQPAHPYLKGFVPISVGGANIAQPPRGTPEQRSHLHCNSLDIAGNTLAVAQETAKGGEPGAGILFYDVSDPANPKLISYYDESGGDSRGAHHVWFENSRFLWVSGGAGNTAMPADQGDPYAGQVFTPKRPDKDYEFVQVIDAADPAHPKEYTRWYYPGVAANDPLPAPDVLPGADNGVRPHNLDVFPDHPTRAYVGMIDGGIVILDASVPQHLKPVAIVRYRGPGFTHTTYPIFTRDMLAVSEEALGPPPCRDGPKRFTLWSIKDETHPVYLSTAPFLDTTKFCPPSNTANNTGRYGSHNIWEGKPNEPSWRSDRYELDSFFRAGVRVFDITDPYAIKDVAHYIPQFNPATDKTGSIQINDVYVDDRGYVYIVDRFGDGLFILSSPYVTCKTGQCHP